MLKIKATLVADHLPTYLQGSNKHGLFPHKVEASYGDTFEKDVNRNRP